MHLSWNEVRIRAASVIQEWWSTVHGRGDTQSFYNDFFEIFGVKRRTVARYEQHVKKLDSRSGFIDLFWLGVLLVEQKSAGRFDNYFDALKESERPTYHVFFGGSSSSRQSSRKYWPLDPMPLIVIAFSLFSFPEPWNSTLSPPPASFLTT